MCSRATFWKRFAPKLVSLPGHTCSTCKQFYIWQTLSHRMAKLGGEEEELSWTLGVSVSQPQTLNNQEPPPCLPPPPTRTPNPVPWKNRRFVAHPFGWIRSGLPQARGHGHGPGERGAAVPGTLGASSRAWFAAGFNVQVQAHVFFFFFFFFFSRGKLGFVGNPLISPHNWSFGLGFSEHMVTQWFPLKVCYFCLVSHTHHRGLQKPKHPRVVVTM